LDEWCGMVERVLQYKTIEQVITVIIKFLLIIEVDLVVDGVGVGCSS
jgi:hypothetical protein